MSEQVPPDPRWALFIGELDAAGRPRPMAHADLVRLTEKWPSTAATPPGVADLLSTARALITLAWFHYESMVVAGMWSLLAVEAALRVRLNSEQQLVKLIKRAQQEGLITVNGRGSFTRRGRCATTSPAPGSRTPGRSAWPRRSSLRPTR